MGGSKKSKIVRMAVVGIIISLITLIAIIKLTETSLTWEAIKKADKSYILIAFFFQTLFWVFWALRLKFVAKCLYHQIPFNYALETSIASMFLAAITPSSAGGEPLRVKMLSDKGMNVGSAVAAVLVERILDSIFFVTALPLFLILSDFSTKLGLEVTAVFGISLFLFIIFLYELLRKPENILRLTNYLHKIARKLNEKKADRIRDSLIKELYSFRNATIDLFSNPKKNLFILFSLTAMLWTVGFLIPSFILLSLGSEPFYLLSYTAQLIIVIISLIPLTPGSSGIAELSMAYFYSKFVSADILGILVGIWRIITYALNIVIGFFVNVKILKSKYIDN